MGNDFSRAPEKEREISTMAIQRVSHRSGIGGRRPPPVPLYRGGDEGEKAFFDDGQVKVTGTLVTIGPSWNQVFTLPQIRGVTHGKNRSTEMADSILKLAGAFLICAGVKSLAAGFTVGLIAGVLKGISGLGGSRGLSGGGSDEVPGRRPGIYSRDGWRI